MTLKKFHALKHCSGSWNAGPCLSIWLNVLFAPKLDEVNGVWTCSPDGSILQECHNVLPTWCPTTFSICKYVPPSHMLRAAMDRWASHGQSQKLLLSAPHSQLLANCKPFALFSLSILLFSLSLSFHRAISSWRFLSKALQHLAIRTEVWTPPCCNLCLSWPTGHQRP